MTTPLDGAGGRRPTLFAPGEYRQGCILAVLVNTPAGIVSHKGIMGDRLGPDGFPTVIHSSKQFKRVVEEAMIDFARKGLSLVCSDGFPGRLPPELVLERARSQIGVPWRVKYNCEHFSRWAHGLPVQSPQLQSRVTKATVGAGLVAAAFAVGKIGGMFA